MLDPLRASLLFALCAVAATAAQNLTGFAFALILIGLASLFDLVPLADAANASSLLALVHAAVHFRLHGLTPQWRVIRPALWTGPIGVVAGVALLGWLDGNSLGLLQGLLGCTIVVSAVLFLAGMRELPVPSGARSFAVAGAVSGLLGGLFASPGPPLVLQMYRQPLDRHVVRQCLLIAFALSAALRIVIVAAAGAISARALLLAAVAAPAIAAVNVACSRFEPVGGTRMRLAVAALLAASGMVLMSRAWLAG